MNRRDFIASTGVGLATILLGGCNFMVQDKAQQQSVALAATNGDKERSKNMKITVITGSPHKEGTSALLADKFIEGAKTAGHNTFRFNAAFEEVHPCIGCDRCGMNGPCIYKDSMEKLNPELLSADLVAFVTPLYYWGMSAQLKTVVDRFYANNSPLHVNKKSVLLATAYDANDWTFKALTEHYQTLLRYMGWENAGIVLAGGCGTRSVIERTDFPNQAYKLGVNL
ncbi:flavodoxin family protein [Sporomusa aerivorans]|uniref:flavodoxin family protein n=1 Tax=Sporomusa aerivorans TaxID=204936 RepID=UPI00352A5BDD